MNINEENNPTIEQRNARKLQEAYVRTTCTRYIGTIHDFVMLNALADTPAARGALAQAAAALRSALA